MREPKLKYSDTMQQIDGRVNGDLEIRILEGGADLIDDVAEGVIEVEKLPDNMKVKNPIIDPENVLTDRSDLLACMTDRDTDPTILNMLTDNDTENVSTTDTVQSDMSALIQPMLSVVNEEYQTRGLPDELTTRLLPVFNYNQSRKSAGDNIAGDMFRDSHTCSRLVYDDLKITNMKGDLKNAQKCDQKCDLKSDPIVKKSVLDLEKATLDSQKRPKYNIKSVKSVKSVESVKKCKKCKKCET